MKETKKEQTTPVKEEGALSDEALDGAVGGLDVNDLRGNRSLQKGMLKKGMQKGMQKGMEKGMEKGMDFLDQ